MAGLRAKRKALKHRDDLTGEHAAGDAGQIILACLFFAIWITDTSFNYTTAINQYVPLAARIPIGLVVLSLSGYLALMGLFIVFVEKRQKPVVIRKSVFGLMRHPIYLSEILLYLGLLIISMSIAAAAVWVFAIVFLHYISRYEERLLLAHFGEEYEQYMRDVPMWVPRLRRK